MPKSIILNNHGDPSVMKYVDIEVRPPNEYEVTLRHTAIGVNYIDVYARNGSYSLITPPGTPGMEAAGVITNVGSKVEGLKLGQRVAYVSSEPGAYCEFRNIRSDVAVPLPDHIDDRAAAALMLKGMTAERMLNKTTLPRRGDTVLVYAAAGGVGQILVSLAKSMGCTVIGIVGSEDKKKIAEECGADFVFDRKSTDLIAEVMNATDGKGCQYIYDGVGRATFDNSLELVAKFGHLVSFGNASGPVPPLNISVLAPKCISLSRPQIFPYISRREDLLDATEKLFTLIETGAIRPRIEREYRLSEAPRAHSDLEEGSTSGQLLLIP